MSALILEENPLLAKNHCSFSLLMASSLVRISFAFALCSRRAETNSCGVAIDPQSGCSLHDQKEKIKMGLPEKGAKSSRCRFLGLLLVLGLFLVVSLAVCFSF